MRWFYTLLLYLAAPFIPLRLLWRSRQAPAYRYRWRERFGFVAPLPTADCLWVHAVSVGEVRAALPLIRALQERYRRIPILVTTMTPTGSQQVLDALGDSVHHVYLPYDLPGAVRRFLIRARPRLGVIVETELWPNLLHACATAKIPVVLANARLSERSARGYARFATLSAAMLQNLALIAAQSQADAERFRLLGAPAERVQVTGNIKYDLTLPGGLTDQGRAFKRKLFGDRPVWIAASTHSGEDEQILHAYARLRERLPKLLLVLVPRHPERFDSVAELCARQGYSVVRRSEKRACNPYTDIFLGDSMGELLLLYAASEVAFVGGSLVERGGHNVLEPALIGLPVAFGPHMFNFQDAGEHLLQAQAARQVADADELAVALGDWLGDPALRRLTGKRAKAAVEANRGALAKLFGSLEEILSTTPAAALRLPNRNRDNAKKGESI